MKLMQTFERVKSKIHEYEKKYQLDIAYIIKNEFCVYLRQAVILITGVAVSVAFARLASKEVFGQYNFILAILAIFSVLSIPGLKNAVLRSVARGREGSYNAAVKTSFLWSLLGIPALLAVGGYHYYYSTPTIGICLMISSVFFPFIHALNIWSSFFQGKRRFDLIAKYGSIQSTVNATAIIAILFLNPTHLVLIVVTNLITNCLLTCLFYLRSQRYIENKARDNECKKYGYFLTTANIAGALSGNIDKILLGILLGPSQLAIYSIAKGIPDRIRMLLKSAWVPFMPKFSQDGNELKDISRKIKRLILPLSLAVAGGSLLYWLFIDDIMLALFSTKYMESIIYARMLLLMILASIPSAFLGTFAIAKRKTKAIVLRSHIFSFLRLLIMYGFIYQWGIMGAVWGLNLNTIAETLLTWAGMRWQQVSQESLPEGS